MATRNHRLAAIHSLFAYLALGHPEHAGSIQRVLAISPKRVQRNVLTYLTEPEIEALLGACNQSTRTGRRDHVMLALAVQTGLRISELIALECGDVTLGASVNVRSVGKGRKQRRTPLIAPITAVLGAWPAELGGDPDEPLFTTSTGRRLSRDAIERRLAIWVERAAIECPSPATGMSRSLRPTSSVPVAATYGTSYSLWAPGAYGDVEDLMFEALGRIGAGHEPSADPALGLAGRTIRQSTQLRTALLPFSGGGNPPVAYPDGHFAESLSGLAGMIDGALPIRCVALNAPGSYDTHDNQPGAFTSGLGQTCDALLAFQRDPGARGIDDRVVTLVWSEFGRRPEQNASDGTDHGAGGCGLLIGKSVAGTMVGEWPGLDALDPDDNLRSTADFRSIYCSLLEQWYGVDAASLIPGASGFARPALIS